jgi:NAD-specific glutamate dehydrogenase
VIEAWVGASRAAVDRYQGMLEELKQADALDVAMLSVALRELRSLAGRRKDMV